MNKNKLMIVFVLIICLSIIIFIFWYHDYRQNSIHLNRINQQMLENFHKTTGFKITLAERDNKIEGDLTGSGSFQGNCIGGDGRLYEIINLNEQLYLKQAESGWDKENKTFLYEMNILAHPEWIQIKKRMKNIKVKGAEYLQYEVIFEKPNQDLANQLSTEQLANLRIFGTILLNKGTYQIKKMTLQQGEDISDAITIDYTNQPSAPKIEAPI